MRSAPSIQITVTRFGAWHTLVALVSGGACLSMALWWWTHALPAPHLVVAAAAFGALGSIVVAATLWRAPPIVLRWDRQRWWVASVEGIEQAGGMTMAIDLGDWLLLRFMADGMPAGLLWRWHPPIWIALQRPGLEAQWHALRCTLYASGPAIPHAGARPPTEGRSA